MRKSKLPSFLALSGDPLTCTAVESLREGSVNCLILLKNLSRYTETELKAILVLELQRCEPRKMVMDKVHARYCKLVRKSQRDELFKCANLK